MTATDPTSGAGYAFGEVLTSAHMTTIANQQPNLLDAIGGGSYTLGTNLTWTTATGITLTFAAAGTGAVAFTAPAAFLSSTVSLQNCTLTVTSSTAATWATGTSLTMAAGSTMVDHSDHTTVDGNWTISGGTWASSGSHAFTAGAAAGQYTFNNVVRFNGNTSFSDALLAAAGGYASFARTAAGASTALSLSGGSAHVATTSGQLIDCSGASGTLTLDNDGATAGSWVMFYHAPAGGVNLSYDWNGSSYASGLTIHPSTAADYQWVILIFNGSTWDLGPNHYN